MLLLIFLHTLSFISNLAARKEHVLAVYGDDKSKIIVKDTELNKTLKTFTVQVPITSGIAVAYKKDLIFFSDAYGTVYRIHLVDSKGDRTKSGKGTLFTDKDADHFELIFYETGYPIIDLVYDEKEKKLFIVTPPYIFSIDPDAEPDDDSKVTCTSKYSTASTFKSQHALVEDGMLYLADSSHVYNAVTDALSYTPLFHVFARLKSITSFAVDSLHKKLYFFSMNSLRVLDFKMDRLDHVNKSKVILANGAVTKAVHSMNVNGGIMVWSSCAWKKLYVAKLNYRRGFIPMKRVSELDSMPLDDDSNDDACFHNIKLIKHDYDA